MKKIFLGALISLLGGSISFVSAVNDNIMVRYCIPDNPKVGEAAAWKLEVPAGLIGTFCIDVINLRNEPVTMRVAAVDGIKTEDGLGTCGLDTEIERFGKYVSGIPNEVKLGPKEVRRFQPTLQFPATMTGQQIGCIAYFDAAQLSGENAVSMIYRSAHVLRATLTPPLRRSLTTHYPTDDIFPAAGGKPAYINIADGSGHIAVEVQNTGSIDQRIAAKCTLTTHGRGTHTYETLTSLTLPAGKQQLLSCSLPVDASMIFQAKAHISLAYQSIGIADQPLIKLPNEYTAIQELTIDLTRYFFPKEMVAMLIGIVLLVIVGIRKFKFLSTRK